MAIKYGFFNSVDGDRLYNAEDLGRYLQGIVSSGVYADSSDSLQVLANGDLTVTVQPGRAMLDCHYLENDEPLALTLAAGATMDRIDAIVMRLDLAERTCSIYVKSGTPATAPVRPSVTRLDNAKEYMLASVYVKKLTASITQSSITDTRSDNSVCGWVTGLIDQVDTSTLFAQMEAALQEKSAQFDTWMNGLAAAVPFEESPDHPGSLCRIQGGETEWLNPPLDLGVEYRTAERHYGFPVYVKRLRFDEWKNADMFATQTMEIPVGVDYFTLVDVTGSFTLGGPNGNGWIDHRLPCGYSDIWKDMGEGATPGVFTILISGSQTLRALDLIVKYTKTF